MLTSLILGLSCFDDAPGLFWAEYPIHWVRRVAEIVGEGPRIDIQRRRDIAVAKDILDDHGRHTPGRKQRCS